MDQPFTAFHLPKANDMFRALSTANKFESFPPAGRVLWHGAILYNNESDSLPIVRTTTRYTQPSQTFATVHQDLVRTIRTAASLPEQLNLNNVMAEIYEPSYKSMKWHSDQALDLDPASYICIYSCYENENEEPAARRRLIYRRKGDEGEASEHVVHMEHNSVIIFSVETNGEYVHKIVAGTEPPKSRWLGLTLRQSKTFIKYVKGVPYFDSREDEEELRPLSTATEQERLEFYRHKSQENKASNYVYPDLYYTLSMH